MTRFVRSAHHRVLIISVLACSLLLGCTAPDPGTGQPGVDAIAPDGSLAILLHVPEGVPQLVALHLTSEQTATQQADIITKSVAADPRSSLSPDGRYLAYRGPHEWQLHELASHKETALGANSQIVEFLPDGTLLFISGTTDQVRLERADPQTYAPAARHTLATTRYVFGSVRSRITEVVRQTVSLSDWLQTTAELNRLENLAQMLQASACLNFPEPQKKAWVLVNPPDTVSVMISTANLTRTWRLDTAHANGLLTLLETQSARYRAQMTAEAERLEAEVRQKATAASQPLTDAQVKTQVEAQITDAVWTKVIFSILGLASPDGSKLLLVMVDPDSSELSFSLYLVPLDSNGTPLTLAEKTDWLPTFHFSPDGSQILFESNRDGTRGYYLAHSDGSNIQRLPIDNATNLCWN